MASETHRRSRSFAGLLAIILLLVGAPAFAAGGEAHAGPNWIELGAAIANFAVYIWLMVRYGAAPLKAHFEGRRAKIASAIEEAKAASERAEVALRAAKEQHAGLEAVRARILNDSETIAVTDAAKVVAAAEVSAAKMITDAAQLLEQEAAAAEVAQVEVADPGVCPDAPGRGCIEGAVAQVGAERLEQLAAEADAVEVAAELRGREPAGLVRDLPFRARAALGPQRRGGRQ